MRKFLVILMCFMLGIMAFGLISCGESDLSSGVTVEISTEEQLFNIKNNLSGSYKLVGDITLTKSWQTVGTSANPFSGVFDGNGHTVSNLVVNSSVFEVDDTSLDYYVGFFGVLKGTVKNLKIEGLKINLNDSVINSTDYQTLLSSNPLVTDFNINAGLVGINKGDIISCNINTDLSINLTEISARIRAGALSGKSNDLINSCKASGSINITNDNGYIRSGGIVGYLSSNGELIKNSSRVDVTTKIITEGKIQVGGIVGNIECGNLSTCYSTGTLKATNTAIKASLVGGLVGLIDNSSLKFTDMSAIVENSYSTANTVAVGDKGYASGCIGQIEFDATVKVLNNSCSGTSTGTKGSYGFVGRIQTPLEVQLLITDFINGVYQNTVFFSENNSVVADLFANTVENISVLEELLFND